MSEQFVSSERDIGIGEAGTDNPEHESNEDKKTIDALIVFGGGIRSDEHIFGSQERDQQDTDALKDPGARSRLRLPEGAKVRVVGAVEMYIDGQVEDVIFTGGRVREAEGIKESEAELMKDYFKKVISRRWRSELLTKLRGEGEEGGDEDIKAEIDQRWREVEPHIVLEDKATNTIENFAHTINYLNNDLDKYKNLAFMSNQFHVDRIVTLANKLATRGEGKAAEVEILKKRKRRRRYQKYLETRFDLEENTEYRKKLLREHTEDQAEIAQNYGMIPESMEKAHEGERRWSKGLEEMPEYWLSNIRFIDDVKKLRMILNGDRGASELLAEVGVDVNSATAEELKSVLTGVERKLPPEEWGLDE